MSLGYRAAPVTIASPPCRVVGGAKVADGAPASTEASSTRRSPGSSGRRSSDCRAAAAAARSSGPASTIERLPNVPRSYGQRSVSPITSRTASDGTPSSVATSSESAVRFPCPTSTLPVKAVTVPSASTWSQAPALVDQLSSARSGSTATTSPSDSTANQSRSAAGTRSHGCAGRPDDGSCGDGATASSTSSCNSAAERMARMIRG